jgi:hypothetical protein
MLQIEAPDIGTPEPIQIRHPRSGPPQPEELCRVRASRQAADLDQDDGAAHDGPRLTRAATGMILLLGVQLRPGAYAHSPVLLILGAVLGGRYRPGRRMLAGKLGAVFAGTPAFGHWCRRRRVGVKTAVGAEADQDSNGKLRHSLGQLYGVVTRIKDEQRCRLVDR